MDCNEFIIKTARFGYDGKGQVLINKNNNIDNIFKDLNTQEVIAEEVVDFACEVSVIIARDKLGQTSLYGPVLNYHENHILRKSVIPAPLPEELIQKAKDITHHLAEAIDLIGVMTLELFITKDGRILANEIAPRTHNSGHWTIDACAVSQFEQHVRTVCGMPVGLPTRHSDAEMINILGREAHKISNWLEMKHANLHLYGKDEIKDGRKMGHVTILKSRDLDEL